MSLLLLSLAAASPIHNVDLLLQTDVPLELGGKLLVEGPYRLRLSTSVGWMPPAYVGLINEVCTSAGWYDDVTASLISAAINNAVVWRTHLGWRPFPKHGFSVEAGYGLAVVTGGVTGSDVVAAATGTEVQASDRLEVLASAQLHLLDVSLAWEWVAWKHLVIRTDLGGAFTIAAPTQLEPTRDVSRPRATEAVDELMGEGEAYLQDTLQTYVQTPTLGVSVGYRF